MGNHYKYTVRVFLTISQKLNYTMHYPVAIALFIVAHLVSSTTQASINGVMPWDVTDESTPPQNLFTPGACTGEADQVECVTFCCPSGTSCCSWGIPGIDGIEGDMCMVDTSSCTNNAYCYCY